MKPIKWWKDIPRLRNRNKMPVQWAVKYAQLDFGFAETCQIIHEQAPRITKFTPQWLIEDDRRLQLKELRERCQEILLRNNVPASQWSDDSCRGV